MNTEIENAQITSTRLGEEHGCLTADLTIEGAGWGCSFGGYNLGSWIAPEKVRGGAIVELMKTLEVESWEELKGQYVRIETEGWGGRILRIGHLMRDKWFSWKEYFDNIKEKSDGQD